MSEVTQTKDVSRRGFLGTLTWAIGALIAAGFTAPELAYIIGPALEQKQTDEWIRLGLSNKVELGVPTLFKAAVERQTGWIVNREEITVYVLTHDGREFTAMSNICTHLGCRVRWIEDRSQFFCPCHNGVFNQQGEVVSGPAPRSLDRFEIKVEDDQIFMRGA
ncbi:MAG: ubiquinol-cytochrome c reductase iron-sulfur subunit [Anaerolineales bacterium]|nr:ubiquinol-cytochrome c reductase iron-sulfur subunit [Anaerolineales bacterium]